MWVIIVPLLFYYNMRALITVKIIVSVHAMKEGWLRSFLSSELDVNDQMNASVVLPIGKALR
jgi:hypothetical protein